ncbi:MAG TPA: hypothetical protein PLR20_00235 [Syntrophales bacterium]|nr:hypothetical protein [Syntrophales bacterium]HOX94958.1 hypothetical protein [Syntrophales bacterium]HPI55799.1 hypothetical protein [Syntrophales bacterium]HPN23709.1 hypothetical protein [Syntrophales bacterium]HQM27765.1 hypothetical protein [Syntrophales bacterium]
MTLQLVQGVRTILGRVTELTGKGIDFVEKEELPVPAMLTMAGADTPRHRLFFKRDHDESVNHVIANECGHVLRLYNAPEEKRLIPVANQKTLGCYTGEMEADIRRLYQMYPPEKLMNLVMFWYESVLYQLTKMPSDIMIEKWLHREYQELLPIQLRSIGAQNDRAVATLAVEIRNTMPGRIYDACNIMNYVYFTAMGKTFGLNYVEPYRFTKYFARGEELISLVGPVEVDSHEGDVLVINLWARYFQFSGWFDWVPIGELPRQQLH